MLLILSVICHGAATFWRDSLWKGDQEPSWLLSDEGQSGIWRNIWLIKIKHIYLSGEKIKPNSWSTLNYVMYFCHFYSLANRVLVNT